MGRYAVRKNFAEAAKKLLSLGADINLASESGRTPLMSAVGNGLGEMVELLVTSGADLKLQSEDGLTAYDLSFRGGIASSPAVREMVRIDTTVLSDDDFDLG